MTHDEVDRILSRKDEILPSSGFVGSVMDSVRQEAATPPPIPFPWRRAVPGIIASTIIVASAVVFFTVHLRHVERVPAVPFQTAISDLPRAAVPLVAALTLTLVSIMFSRRLTSD